MAPIWAAGTTRKWRKLVATPINPSVLEVIADGDKVAVQWDGRASAKNGQPYNQRYCWVMRLEGPERIERSLALWFRHCQSAIQSACGVGDDA